MKFPSLLTPCLSLLLSFLLAACFHWQYNYCTDVTDKKTQWTYSSLFSIHCVKGQKSIEIGSFQVVLNIARNLAKSWGYWENKTNKISKMFESKHIVMRKKSLVPFGYAVDWFSLYYESSWIACMRWVCRLRFLYFIS